MRKFKFLFGSSILILILLAILAANVGVVRFSLAQIFNFDFIFWNLRLPRIVLAILCGAGLSICGCAYQAVFRNPLCDPYILGISSGAALGAAIALILGWESSILGITGCALCGGLLTVILILQFSRLGNRSDHSILLLSGVSLNFLLAAVLAFLMVLNQESMDKIIFWTMGSFASASWLQILILTPVVLLGSLCLLFLSKPLNLLMHQPLSAQTLGINVKRTRKILLIITTLMIAFIVSYCGVIGFAGLIVPHIVRLLVGGDHRKILPLALVLGSAFMLLADTLSRTILPPSELPVGSITALLGTPLFIFLLVKNS